MRRDEFELIQWLNADQRSASGRVRVGIGDDAAVVASEPDKEMVVTCDTMVDTVHFRSDTMTPFDVGHKALAANVSDIVAMGGNPRFALVSLAVSEDWSDDALKDMYRGIHAFSENYAVDVIGGDTVKTPDALCLSITLLGDVEKGRALQRSAACPGDKVFVTGWPGQSAAGLCYLTEVVPFHSRFPAIPNDVYEPLVRAHQRPEPRVEAGRRSLKAGVHALNDISDGVAGEAREIAEASHVQLHLEKERLPLSPPLSAFADLMKTDPVKWVLHGGEDFQLLGTVPTSKEDDLKKRLGEVHIPLTVIGDVREGPPAVFMKEKDRVARRIERKGYTHF